MISVFGIRTIYIRLPCNKRIILSGCVRSVLCLYERRGKREEKCMHATESAFSVIICVSCVCVCACVHYSHVCAIRQRRQHPINRLPSGIFSSLLFSFLQYRTSPRPYFCTAYYLSNSRNEINAENSL